MGLNFFHNTGKGDCEEKYDQKQGDWSYNGRSV